MDRETLELRLAMLAITVSMGSDALGRGGCAKAMDEASRFASRATKAVMTSIAAPLGATIRVRFGALRSINTACAACAACHRGRAEETAEDPAEAVMLRLDRPKAQ